MPNLLQVKLYGCEILKRVAEPIKELTPEIKVFIEDLIYTMYETDGVGIAAPQVGYSKRIFICDPHYSKTEVKSPIVCINPEFIEFEGEYMSEEGCLSVPNIFEKVRRFETVKMQYRDMAWNLQTITADEMFAVILQHELDHLNGISLIDRISPLRKMALGFKLNRIVQKSQQMFNSVEVIKKDD